MKLPTCLLPFALLATATAAQPTPAPAAIPSKEVQIKAALQAAAPQFRDGAMVYGYDERGQFVVLRPGTNKLICLADDPAMKGFSAACYHQDLEPFMARGRELAAQGKKAVEITKIREEDVKSGKLKMPDRGVLNVTTGKHDAATGEVTELYTRYVVYIPYATPDTTGIPLAPATPGGPWIMDAGTHRAHIMINPPKPK